ncbi:MULTISPECIES: hypothetical protein [Trichocoleus]|uniref:Uncharacterized protein n=1 Tax=Trichocoleus desertorum GB2-A4 TaxID=2933944 RepID=A0ABV0J8W5_9CYAN|nr:hypothetical protein [Trichocoleus sp. FACHB-46]MBD1862513.1 hypothetical protein [Trichocoleus sp. FACHB-46]
MNTSNVFRQIIEEIDQIKPSIQLQLPANPRSVKQQIQKITLAQKKLREIEERVYLFGNRGGNGSAYRTYLSVKALIHGMIHDGNHFKLLAEEYFVDPEGTVTLLHDAYQRDLELRYRIHHLQALGLSQSQITFAIWRVKAESDKAYQVATKEYQRLTGSCQAVPERV